MNKGLLICCLFLLIISLQITTSFGTLNTAKIGMQVNLSETDEVKFTIKTTNPTNEILFVTLIPQNFTEINTNKIMDFNIEAIEYELQQNKSKESIITITEIENGQYEGIIKVVFEKEGIKQKTSLNSVIQLNVFSGEESNLMYLIIIPIIVVLGIIIILLIKKNKNQSIERRLN